MTKAVRRSTRTSETKRVILRLYVAGGSPTSVRAVRNLERLCGECVEDYRIETIDVFENPRRALADDVLVTPMLVRVSPGPTLRILGDLSEDQTVRALLGRRPPES